jgi:hypothetical protein
LLSADLFDYYGRGCRSVSKLWLSPEVDVRELPSLIRTPENHWDSLPAYQHNYQYQKALCQMQGQEYIDGGNFLMFENQGMVSPIAVVYIQTYPDFNWLEQHLNNQKDKLQAVYSHEAWFPGSTAWGQAQTPDLTDYADQIDTLEFLSSY